MVHVDQCRLLRGQDDSMYVCLDWLSATNKHDSACGEDKSAAVAVIVFIRTLHFFACFFFQDIFEDFISWAF
jgi:hypothetical protein